MAQGSMRKKNSVVQKKTKTQKKSLGPKKGGRVIKPKKVSKKAVVTVKRKLEVQIKESIETTAVHQATKQEHKPLALIKSSGVTTAKKKSGGKKGKNGRGKK